MNRCILFDLDGTLIDGVDDLVAAVNVVLRKHQLQPLTRHELEPMLGDGMRVLTQRGFAARANKLTEQELDIAFSDVLAAYKATAYANTRLYPGVADTLKQLHADGWRIGLASNKLTNPCESILQRLGVRELFDVVAGGDATNVKKPAAGHLLYALERMGYRPGDKAVMVGDHANDIDAARAAGIAAIAVALEVDATRARSLGADAVITDLTELLACLRRIASLV